MDNLLDISKRRVLIVGGMGAMAGVRAHAKLIHDLNAKGYWEDSSLPEIVHVGLNMNTGVDGSGCNSDDALTRVLRLMREHKPHAIIVACSTFFSMRDFTGSRCGLMLNRTKHKINKKLQSWLDDINHISNSSTIISIAQSPTAKAAGQFHDLLQASKHSVLHVGDDVTKTFITNTLKTWDHYNHTAMGVLSCNHAATHIILGCTEMCMSSIGDSQSKDKVFNVLDEMVNICIEDLLGEN